MAIACDEARTVECRMAAPHGGDPEPTRGSVDCVGPAMETGEVKIIWETCWTRLVTAERVTVTEREKVNGVTETCMRRVETREIIKQETEVMNEVTELTETQRETQELKEITETWEIEGELKETKDEHTHMELARDNEGELGECSVIRCKQLDGLLREQGEGICPLEADHDQVGPVELCEVEGASAVNGYMRSLGGVKAPGPLVEVRIPSLVVQVCVFRGVAKCVLRRAHSVGERRRVKETACVSEMARVSNMVCVGEMVCFTERPCVRDHVCERAV